MSDALLLLVIGVAWCFPLFVTFAAGALASFDPDVNLNWWQSRLFGTLFLLAVAAFALVAIIKHDRFQPWFLVVYAVLGVAMYAVCAYILANVLDVRKPRGRKVKRLPIS